ncbi:MAG TPA: hypothetical protein VFK15_11395 [Burkholderiales bacterium]|jgi:hypothetical protein|nr:hypothetical protein [Burkholderiales bacterium]
MIFSALIGAVLGFTGIPAPLALLGLAGALAGKLFVDLRWRKLPLVGSLSPFIVYCHNLQQRGESTEQAHLSYAMQFLFFGGSIGVALFALARALH